MVFDSLMTTSRDEPEDKCLLRRKGKKKSKFKMQRAKYVCKKLTYKSVFHTNDVPLWSVFFPFPLSFSLSNSFDLGSVRDEASMSLILTGYFGRLFLKVTSTPIKTMLGNLPVLCSKHCKDTF